MDYIGQKKSCVVIEHYFPPEGELAWQKEKIAEPAV